MPGSIGFDYDQRYGEIKNVVQVFTMNGRGALIGVPGLFYVGLMLLVTHIDVSRNTRAVIIALGAVASVAATAMIAIWARKIHR